MERGLRGLWKRVCGGSGKGGVVALERGLRGQWKRG